MGTEALTVVRGGINRLRQKGSPPKDSLYDLLNGYVTAARTVKVRPGTFRAFLLPEGTKGLTAADGKLHVFTTDADLAGDVTSEDAVDPLVEVYAHLVNHPEQIDTEENAIPLLEVHFAEKFMGFMYVAAEFDTDSDLGTTFHYWLETGDTWQADTQYDVGDLVAPTNFQGIYYKALRLNAPNPLWAPNTQIEVADKREPTVYNGFYYEATEVFGSTPTTSTVEPTWPTEEGETVTENTQATFDGLADTATDDLNQPTQATQDRYGGLV